MSADSSAIQSHLMPAFVAGSSKGAVRSFCEGAWNGYIRGGVGVESANRPNGLIRIETFNLKALTFAYQCLLQRHPILNCYVEDRNSTPWLVPATQPPPPISILDTNSDIDGKIAEIVWSAFDLSKPPLYRIYAVRLGPDEYYVGLVVHHFISDGFSTDILLGELSHLYNALSRGKMLSLPQAGLSYQDYLHAMNVWMERPDVQDVRQSGVKRLKYMPTIGIGQAEQTEAYESDAFIVSAEVANATRGAARKLNTTVFNLLLLAQQIAMRDYCSTPYVPMKVITTGRDAPPLLRTVGNLADRIFVLTDLSGDPDVAEMVGRIHNAMQQARKYKFIRSDFLHAGLAQAGIPTTAMVFNFRQIRRQEPTTREGVSQSRAKALKVPPPPTAPARRPKDYYYLNMSDDGEEMVGVIQYGHGRISGFLKAFEAVLGRLCSGPETRLSDLTTVVQSGGEVHGG